MEDEESLNLDPRNEKEERVKPREETQPTIWDEKRDK